LGNMTKQSKAANIVDDNTSDGQQIINNAEQGNTGSDGVKANALTKPIAKFRRVIRSAYGLHVPGLSLCGIESARAAQLNLDRQYSHKPNSEGAELNGSEPSLPNPLAPRRVTYCGAVIHALNQ